MSANGISTLSTKQLKQEAKLDIAQLKRSGYSSVVAGTTAYSAGSDFNFADIKITVNDVDDVYLHFYNSVPTISDQLTVGTKVTIDWDGRAPNTVAYIASTLIDFPGHAWRAQGLGFLLTVITTTELPGNSEDYNIDALHVPNGQFTGGGSADDTKPYYRIANTLDTSLLPTKYSGDTLFDNPNTGGLVEGRPWSTTNPDTEITVIETAASGATLILNLDSRNINSLARGASPGTWYDLTSNHNDATIYGTVAYGLQGGQYCAVFPGANTDYVQALSGAYFTGGSFTVQSWVYVTQVRNWNRIFDFGNSAGPNNVLLANSYGVTGKPGIYISGQQFQSTLAGSSSVLLNGWHQICCTFNYVSGPNGTATIYVDGQPAGSGTLPKPVNEVRNNCYIGRSNWGFGDPNMQGGIGSLQIYNGLLTDAEMLSNYNTTKSYYGL